MKSQISSYRGKEVRMDVFEVKFPLWNYLGVQRRGKSGKAEVEEGCNSFK